MKKINILYIINSMDVGGAERHLVDVLNNLDRKKFVPFLACIRKQGPFLKQIKKDVKIIDLKGYLSGFFRLKKLLEKEKVDIIQGYLSRSCLFSVLAAKLLGIKTIITSRRLVPEAEKNIFLFLNMLINPFVDLVICNSKDVLDKTIKVEKLDYKKTKLIYNGKDIKRLPKKVNIKKKKKEIGINEKEQVVGCVANLEAYKGHKYLLKAAYDILKENPNVSFVLVGNGRKRRGLIKQAERLGIRENIIFTGRREDVHEIIQLFDVAVLSSLGEGFSNASLEYMACAKPMVLTTVGGSREVIVNGKNGFLVNPRDPEALAININKILKNKSLAKKMGLSSKKLLRKFGLRNMILQMEDTYLSLFKEKENGK